MTPCMYFCARRTCCGRICFYALTTRTSQARFNRFESAYYCFLVMPLPSEAILARTSAAEGMSMAQFTSPYLA